MNTIEKPDPLPKTPLGLEFEAILYARHIHNNWLTILLFLMAETESLGTKTAAVSELRAIFIRHRQYRHQ
jgi:hypothetical protein